MRTKPLPRSPARTVFCAVLAVAVATLLAAPMWASASIQPNSHGVISAMNGFSLSQASPLGWDSQLAGISLQGVQEVRSDAAWDAIQPQPPGVAGPGWHWSKYDAWVSSLAAHGLTWQPILDYNSPWARADLDSRDFSAFAQAVAARYGASGTFWAAHPELPYLPAGIFEIWNEENASTRYMNPVIYGQLYLAARKAIRAVDPAASVDIGGLAESGTSQPVSDPAAQYLGVMLLGTPGLKGNIDAIALHLYAPSATDSTAWVARFRHAASQMGVGWVPIDLTEFGWAYDITKEPWRATQMDALGGVFSRSNCGVRLAAPYDWINSGDPTEDRDFGFVDTTGTSTALRPAGAAWFSAFAQYSAQPTFVIC